MLVTRLVDGARQISSMLSLSWPYAARGGRTGKAYPDACSSAMAAAAADLMLNLLYAAAQQATRLKRWLCTHAPDLDVRRRHALRQRKPQRRLSVRTQTPLSSRSTLRVLCVCSCSSSSRGGLRAFKSSCRYCYHASPYTSAGMLACDCPFEHHNLAYCLPHLLECMRVQRRPL